MTTAIRVWTVLLGVALLSACATTSVSSFTDPAFQGSTFRTVAIWVDTNDLEWRQDMETSMTERVSTVTGARAIRVLDLAPPTRSYETTSVFGLIENTGTQAAIVVRFTETGVSQAVGGDEDGVYTTESPWATATVELYEIESGAMVWTATAKTQGNALSDWSMVLRSAGNKVIAELLTDGLLPPPEDD